jgi:hypothetical protein
MSDPDSASHYKADTDPRVPAVHARARIGLLQLLRFAAPPSRARALRCQLWQLPMDESERCAGSGASALVIKKAASVGEVAGHFVLEPEFLFLEAVEKVFVGMGSVLFFLDQGVKSLVLRLEFLDHCLVHWRRSFQSACHHRVIKHESLCLS